jgi:hypothetical protein
MSPLPPSSYPYGHYPSFASSSQPRPTTPSERPVRSIISAVPNSSPVASDTDPTELLQEYIEWHIQKTPLQEWPLRDALKILQDQYYDMEGLRKLKESNWQQFEVPLGLGVRLSRDIKVFLQGRSKKSEEQAQNATQALLEIQDEALIRRLRQRARDATEPLTP